MQKFKEIVCIDKTMLLPSALEELQKFADLPVRSYEDYPREESEIIHRIGQADALLLSWHSPISAHIIAQAPQLRYIGLCSSLYDQKSSNIDLKAAAERKIDVRGVKDYANEGVVEYIFSQLISLAKGLGRLQWKEQPTELKGKTMGIIGLGKTGQLVASLADAFGMDVIYYSRTRKNWLENETLQYASFRELVSKADVISTHLPRNTRLLRSRDFEMMKADAVLINTSLGPTFEPATFEQWIQKDRHFAIIDADGAGMEAEMYRQYPERIMYTEQAAGSSDLAHERLSKKVIRNIRSFLEARML